MLDELAGKLREHINETVQKTLCKVGETTVEQIQKVPAVKQLEALIKATFALSFLSFGLSVVILIVVLVKR